MATNLLELLSGAITPTIVQSLSTFLGERDSAIQSGIGSLMPALLGGMADKASTTPGAASLFTMLTGSNVDIHLPGNLSSVLTSGRSSSLLGLGGSLLSGLFGSDKAAGAGSALASVSGLKSASAGSLISVALPVVFSVLKKLIGERSLDAPGVAALLLGQKDALTGKLNALLTSAFGLGSPSSLLAGLGAATPGAARAAERPVAVAASATPRWWPLILGAAVLAALALMLSRCNPAQNVGPTTISSVPAAPAAAVQLPTKIYFETGVADVGAEGSATIKAVATLLAGNAATKVDLTGYTDKTGDTAANETLAKNRALNVKAALQAAGVAAERIGTKPPLFVEIGAGGSTAEARRVDIVAQ